MAQNNIYISDLIYTSQGRVSEFVPYGIGCLKSYYLEYSENKDEFNISLFKYPQKLIDSFQKNKPNIVAFANYIWSANLSYVIAREIKKVDPDILVIFGGPNYPIEDKLREKWLQDRNEIDIYIVGDGEKPFMEVIDLWHETRDIGHVKRSGIEGCHSLVQGKLCGSNDTVPRLKRLDSYPSPYMKGYLDDFLEDTGIVPLNPTTRGCPFSCTFCTRGFKCWTKIARKSPARFREEIEYISKKTTVKLLSLTDDNFGIFPQDIEISEILARTKKEMDYPHYILSASLKGGEGKKIEERVLKCAEILEGSLPVNISVQALDPDILANIKRKNISMERLIEIVHAVRKMGASSRSELIIALPGDTKEKHFEAILQLVDANVQYVLSFTLMLLDGSELASAASRKKWNMKTKYRLSHRCYGKYRLGETEIYPAEIEEVVIGLDTLSFEDYLECRSIDLTMSIFYCDDILCEVLEYLKSMGIKSSEFISIIHDKQFSTLGLDKLYKSFINATKNELWDNEEELRQYVKSELEKDKSDTIIGYNILFKHRAIAYMELVDDITEVSFKAAKRLLIEKDAQYDPAFLSELEIYNKLRKRNILDFEKTYEHKFNYNFCEFVENDYTGLPRKFTEPTNITFYHTEKQKSLFEGFKPGIEGAMRIIVMLSLPQMYRALKC